jgi:hypothetical protein
VRYLLYRLSVRQPWNSGLGRVKSEVKVAGFETKVEVSRSIVRYCIERDNHHSVSGDPVAI